MKRKTVALALLMCMVMVLGSLSGCGKKEGNKKTDTPNKKQEEVKTDNSDEKEQGEQEEQKDTDTETGTDTKTGTDTEETDSDVLTELTLPLSKEKAEISIWTTYQSAYVDDPNELIGVQEMEKRTNVHVNWNIVSNQEATEKFGLMLASGNLPDIIYGQSSYPGGSEKGVEEGILLDLTEIVAKYMPNYREQRLTDERLAKDTITDSRRIVEIYSLNCDDDGIRAETEWTGLGIRQDMLDSLGLPLPETIEDWETVLKAAKDAGADAPLLIGPNGYTMTAPFMTAYGVFPGFFQENGVIKYGPAEPGYRDWVELFRRWYAEGLIDTNFVATGYLAPMMGDAAYTVSNRSIAYPCIWNHTYDGYVTAGIATNPEVRVTGVKNPVLKKGDTPIAKSSGIGAHGSPTWISTSCKNVELVAQWLDYQYTLEGMRLNMYGVEGVTYNMEDGDYVYTDLIMKNPDGYTPRDAIGLYARGSNFGRYDWEYLNHLTENYDLYTAAKDVWSEQDISYDIPDRITLTAEEGNEFNRLNTALTTHVEERTVKYIMGTESLDTYDQFIQQMYDTYNLEQCISYQQAALDRYNNR